MPVECSRCKMSAERFCVQINASLLRPDPPISSCAVCDSLLTGSAISVGGDALCSSSRDCARPLNHATCAFMKLFSCYIKDAANAILIIRASKAQASLVEETPFLCAHALKGVSKQVSWGGRGLREITASAQLPWEYRVWVLSWLSWYADCNFMQFKAVAPWDA